MNHIESVRSITAHFVKAFSIQEFESEKEFDLYVAKADQWWASNQNETEEQYEFRKNFARPSMGAVIKTTNSSSNLIKE